MDLQNDISELIKQKYQIETRIEELGQILKEQDDVGMTGNLIDNEGYPRADIDIYKIRLTRQEINCLQNDYKSLIEQIDSKGLSLSNSNNKQLFNNLNNELPKSFIKITQVDQVL
jgi:hypothetical protein